MDPISGRIVATAGGEKIALPANEIRVDEMTRMIS